MTVEVATKVRRRKVRLALPSSCCVKTVGTPDGVASVTDLRCRLSDLGGRRLLKQGEHDQSARKRRRGEQR
jgi:hypothetical protein